jgi:hypothetical protein
MPLPTAMDTALAGDRVLLFGAVRIELPGYSLRLLDGSGFAVFDGGTFLGIDPVFGTLAAISELTDGAGDEAPAIGITILPPTDTAAATLAAAAMQGSIVTVKVGAMNMATGAVIGDPYLLFVGEIDVPGLASGAEGRTLEYEVVSVLERLFDDDEGARLVDGYHQSIWPGEMAFFDVTGIEQTVYWGQTPPKGSITYGSGGGGGGNFGTRGDEVQR